MFYCQITKTNSKSNEKCHKVVIATRERVYTEMVYNEETRQDEELEVARGWEIVREINATERGVALWDNWTPDERKNFVAHLD